MKNIIIATVFALSISSCASAAEISAATASDIAIATQTIAPGNDPSRSVAMLDFFVRARFPLNALEKTVEPVGDDVFAAERKGLERTLRRLMYGILRNNTKCDTQRLQSVDSLEDLYKKVFLYYTAPPTPDGYFRPEEMAQIGEKLKADLVFAGVIEELAFSDMGKPTEKVSLKVGFVLFDVAEKQFIYAKSFLKKLDEVQGFPDKSLLPRIQGRVPDDIDFFADSDTGRVFLAIAEDFLNDFTGGEIRSYLGASFEGRDFEEIDSPDGATIDRESGNAVIRSGAVTAECSDKNQAAIMTLPAAKEGLRIYSCRDGLISFSEPESETDRIVASSRGISTLSSGDFDGDGFDELLVASHEMDQRLRVYKLNDRRMDSDAWLSETVSIFSESGAGLNAATGDFDGDGIDEAAVSPDSNFDDVVILKYKNGSFDKKQPFISFRKNFSPSGFGAMPAAGDFNGDGRDELVIVSQGAGEYARIFELPGGLKTRPKLIGDLSGFFGGVSRSTSVATGDFNGDGRDELVLGSMDHGVQILVIEARNGKFMTDAPMGYLNLNLDSSTAGARVFAGDIDGDGKDDLAISVIGSEGEFTVFRYMGDKFRLSNPYVNATNLYDKTRNGMIMTIGKFN